MLRQLSGAALICAVLFSSFAAPAFAQSRSDVLVVGGTPAGVAAAVSAARAGAEVTLVAGRPELGGVLTDAMMDQWDLNVAPGGATIQGGLFREIHAALGDAFAPADAAREFARLVAGEPRIALIAPAKPESVETLAGPDGRIAESVRFARAGGTFEVSAAEVVDATDDGDVAALAGAPYDVGRQDTGRDERMQAVTLMFTLRGVDWERVENGYDVRAFGAGGTTARRAWGYAKLLAAYRAHEPDVVVRDVNFGRESDGEVTVNAIDVLGVDGRSDASLAHARTASEAETAHLIRFLRARIPGFDDATLGRFADALYVRETRHFAGIERLTAGAVWDGTIPPDTIGLSSYPLDLHPVTAQDEPAYAPVRHVYGIPFGTMVPRTLANLVLASPAISATHIASGSARVIPTTIEEGEAAGIAAAYADRHRVAFTTIARDAGALAAIRERLAANGAILSYDAARAGGEGTGRSSGATRAYGKL
jgi:hypothetical protein